ncbi:hypothetical protein [Azohydromonas aeria]|uniref:hypothetical protein n=1 Tax=Azohydromonas aeria TaxID=2590212 RepID=UPI0012FC650D|nr:hypothetical protein [Azohydromonas aeria]
MSLSNGSRREFVKRGAYVAPAVLTLAAAPEFAKAGSVKPGPGGGKPDKPGKGPPDPHPGKGGGKGRGDDRPGRGNGRG